MYSGSRASIYLPPKEGEKEGCPCLHSIVKCSMANFENTLLACNIKFSPSHRLMMREAL